MISYTIEENRLEGVVDVLNKIPEFDHLPSLDAIRNRLHKVPHLVLTGHSERITLGFKIGYERDGRFYSWLGAVLPEYRNKGVASALADRQEKWAKQQGYASVWMKTRNCFPSMLIMAIGRGFRIIGFDPREEIGQHRIVLEKSI
jgi:predicted GNAT superfamily acetyltransferase